MSGKLSKRLRRAVRKDNRRVILEFRHLVKTMKFKQRLVFAWKILRKIF